MSDNQGGRDRDRECERTWQPQRTSLGLVVPMDLEGVET